VDRARRWGADAALAKVRTVLATLVPDVAPSVAHSVDGRALERREVGHEFVGILSESDVHRDPGLGVVVGVRAAVVRGLGGRVDVDSPALLRPRVLARDFEVW